MFMYLLMYLSLINEGSVVPPEGSAVPSEGSAVHSEGSAVPP